LALFAQKAGAKLQTFSDMAKFFSPLSVDIFL